MAIVGSTLKSKLWKWNSNRGASTPVEFFLQPSHLLYWRRKEGLIFFFDAVVAGDKCSLLSRKIAVLDITLLGRTGPKKVTIDDVRTLRMLIFCSPHNSSSLVLLRWWSYYNNDDDELLRCPISLHPTHPSRMMSPLKDHLGGFDISDSSNCLNKQELHDHGTSFCFTTTNNKHAFFAKRSMSWYAWLKP